MPRRQRSAEAPPGIPRDQLGPDGRQVGERGGQDFVAEVGSAREGTRRRRCSSSSPQVYCRHVMQKLNVRWNASSCCSDAFRSSSSRASAIASENDVSSFATKFFIPGERANASEPTAAPRGRFERVSRAASFAERLGQDLGHRAPVYARVPAPRPSARREYTVGFGASPGTDVPPGPAQTSRDRRTWRHTRPEVSCGTDATIRRARAPPGAALRATGRTSLRCRGRPGHARTADRTCHRPGAASRTRGNRRPDAIQR